MCIIIYNLNLSSLAEFTIFNRLSDLNDGIGVRGVLVEQSVALLTNDPVCWVVGCGFGFLLLGVDLVFFRRIITITQVYILIMYFLRL